jgi:hypothetical protein
MLGARRRNGVPGRDAKARRQKKKSQDRWVVILSLPKPAALHRASFPSLVEYAHTR